MAECLFEIPTLTNSTCSEFIHGTEKPTVFIGFGTKGFYVSLSFFLSYVLLSIDTSIYLAKYVSDESGTLCRRICACESYLLSTNFAS